MTTNPDKPENDVEALEELMDKAADADEMEAERHVQSPEGQRALREIEEHSEQVIREARRRALEAAASGGRRTTPTIPQRILAMTKEAIVARIEELRGIFDGALAVQYRDLDAQSVDDLRSLLAEIERRLVDSEPEA